MPSPELAGDRGEVREPLPERRVVHEELEAAARARGDRIVVSDIPLLFEAADPSDFDVIVSDIRMPGFDGRNLFRFLSIYMPDYTGRDISEESA